VNDTIGVNDTANTGSPKKSSKNTTSLKAELGIGSGVFILALIVLGLGYWNLRRNAKKAAKTDAIPLDDLKP
jgi:cytochrome oxidase assembly protein ShyY1